MSDMASNKTERVMEETSSAPFDAVDGTLPEDTLVVNYFNFFTEVEERFVRRRGKHLYISSLDWAIIESWKDMGIPLHIVLRGIDRVFDAYEANNRANSGKLINSILYCQQEVLAGFEDYKHTRIGATPEASASSDSDSAAASASLPFSKEVILDYLTGRGEFLKKFTESLNQKPAMILLQEALDRTNARLDEIVQSTQSAHTLDLETLEQELSRLETMLYEALLQCLLPTELDEVRKEGKRQLRDYKKRMDPEVYQQTLDHYVAKRLRENHQLPRLSLFYL